MVRKLLLGVVLAAVAVTVAAQNPAPAQAPAPAQKAAAAPGLTVDQVIAKNIQARGGMDKLKAVNSMRVTGKITTQGMDLPMVLEEKRPHNFRMEFTVQGMAIVQAYDGKTGWIVMPLQGNKDPQPMSPDDLKNAEDQADIDGVLVDSAQKGHKVELVGKEPVEGTDAYKLKVTMKSGDVRYIFLDADSFLEIRTEGKRTVRGTDMEFESSIGDYKEVEGLMIPFSVEEGPKGGAQRAKITFDKVEINPVLDDARFKMPEVKPEPKPEEKKPGL